MPQEQDKGEGSKAPEKNAAFKENVIRLVTVFAYVSSVSMAALVLSSYYVFFWEPKPPGPGPPVIHPHAYMAEPYPPLKLVALPPEDHETEGASFWQSVWSYLKPDDKESTRSPMTYKRRKTTSSNSYNYTRSTVDTTTTTEIFNDTDHEISTLMTVLGTDNIMILDKKTSSLNNINDIKPTEGVLNEGYVGIIPKRDKRSIERRETTLGKGKINIELKVDVGTKSNESEVITTTVVTNENIFLQNKDVRIGDEKNESKTITDIVDNTDVEVRTRRAEVNGTEIFKSDANKNSTEEHGHTRATVNYARVENEHDKDYIKEIRNTKGSAVTKDLTTKTITTAALELELTSTINKLNKRNIQENDFQDDRAKIDTKENTNVETGTRPIEVESGRTIKNPQMINTVDNTNVTQYNKSNYTEAESHSVHSIADEETSILRAINTENLEVVFAVTRKIMIKHNTNEGSTGDVKNYIKTVTPIVNDTDVGIDNDNGTKDEKNHNMKAITSTQDTIDNTKTSSTRTTTAKWKEPFAGTINKMIKRDTNQNSTDGNIYLQETSQNYSKAIDTKSEVVSQTEKEYLDISNPVTKLSVKSETNASRDSKIEVGPVTKSLEISNTKDSEESVTKVIDPVTIEEKLSTEFGTQYQHHMRILRPRRKFPSL